MSVTIVVPCYNEQHRLNRQAYLEFAWQNRAGRILFVNDGSTDGTQGMLDMLAAAVPGMIEVLALPQNQGKAEAVRQGMLASMASNDEFVGYWDADLATPLTLIPDFLSVLRHRDEVDAVLGSRLPLLGRRINRTPRRRLLGKCFAAVASRVLGYPIVDTQCGAKFFRVTPQLQAAVQQPFVSRWIFDVELLHRLGRACDEPIEEFARRLYELPLAEWQEVGDSRLKFRDFLRAPLELLQIARSRPIPPFSELPSPRGISLEEGSDDRRGKAA